MRANTIKRLATWTLFGLLAALSGCVFTTKQSQIEALSLAEPPISTGFYVRGNPGKEGEAVRLERSPEHSRGLLLVKGKEVSPLKFVQLDRANFLVEQSFRTDSGDTGYAYHLAEVDRVQNTITALIPDDKIAVVQLLLRKHGFKSIGDELSAGAKHDMVALFNGLLAIENSGTKILDRSIFYRRVSTDEWNAVNARLLEEERSREIRRAQEAQEARERQDQVLRTIRTVMNSTERCGKYQVRPGNSAWHIAEAAGLSLDQLKDINPHIDMRALAVNDLLNFKLACKGF